MARIITDFLCAAARPAQQAAGGPGERPERGMAIAPGVASEEAPDIRLIDALRAQVVAQPVEVEAAGVGMAAGGDRTGAGGAGMQPVARAATVYHGAGRLQIQLGQEGLVLVVLDV